MQDTMKNFGIFACQIHYGDIQNNLLSIKKMFCIPTAAPDSDLVVFFF